MHTAATATETLQILWNNYLTLSERVDLEAMPQELLVFHSECESPEYPFRVAAWLARQGYFIAAWVLWEYYGRNLCEALANKKRKSRGESTVDWVAKSLAANGVDFHDREWFSSANCLRNAIAHYGTRAVGSRAVELLKRARHAFPDIRTWKDGYIKITHSQLADLTLKIEDFIRATAACHGSASGA
jgi:hypothetical protein